MTNDNTMTLDELMEKITAELVSCRMGYAVCNERDNQHLLLGRSAGYENVLKLIKDNRLALERGMKEKRK